MQDCKRRERWRVQRAGLRRRGVQTAPGRRRRPALSAAPGTALRRASAPPRRPRCPRRARRALTHPDLNLRESDGAETRAENAPGSCFLGIPSKGNGIRPAPPPPAHPCAPPTRPCPGFSAPACSPAGPSSRSLGGARLPEGPGDSLAFAQREGVGSCPGPRVWDRWGLPPLCGRRNAGLTRCSAL